MLMPPACRYFADAPAMLIFCHYISMMLLFSVPYAIILFSLCLRSRYLRGYAADIFIRLFRVF